MKKIAILLAILAAIPAFAQQAKEPMQTGQYEPTWQSLSQYQAPEWFKNAKFGIWAHWGPQCQPEQGDWYARFMYYTGTSAYNYHTANYGSPSTFGFKDVINTWKAAKWDVDYLVQLYKKAGAEYFFAMANHHDNLDMYNSKYQPWNSVAVGPKKDIIGGWSDAAKKYGLPFGVSVHASHAWTWLEASQDFDGKLTAADGTGKWWEGLDPQELYAQNHARSTGSSSSGTIHSQWNWGNGASIPDEAYLTKFYNRTIDLINKYNPDLLYFDDTALPFCQISNVGLEIAAHMYNKSIAEKGSNNAVIFGKILTEEQKNCLVWDVERGIPDRPQQKYWQTCTCIGDWHYNRNVYNNNGYKSAQTVIRMLIDIVSKNGNLLLNVPVRGDGTIDEKELAVVQGITAWMDINKESIHGTSPWTSFGEGPTAEAVNPLSAQGFNEGTTFTANDIRYVSKKDTVYATIMGWPEKNTVTLKALSSASQNYLGTISSVKLLGYGNLTFTHDQHGLNVTFPSVAITTGSVASVLKIEFGTALYTSANLSELITQCATASEAANQLAGVNTGQYVPDSIQVFNDAINVAKAIPTDANETQLRQGIETLQSAFYHFMLNGKVKGGKLLFDKTQNITRAILEESRNFSRSDAGIVGAGRWGLLAEPWIYTNNIVNQETNSRGGFDNYGSSRSIGIQKWNASDAAIVDGMIYQTATLPAGSYKLKIKVHENWGLKAGEDYLCVAKGNTIPLTANVTTEALSYYDMSGSSSGGQYTVCAFTLTEQAEVAIGWVTTLAASATNRSMRVNEILLLDNNDNDISANYLKNYTNIQRKDMSYTRFGTPFNWTVENFTIPQSNSSDGTKNGIDRYSGFKALMMGVWDDAARSTGNLKDVKIYVQVTLPAGRYAFTAAYDAVYKLTNMNLFVSKTLPALSDLASTLTHYSVIGDTNDGTHYGLEFTLTEETTVYMGWIGDISDVPTQELRVKELSLHRILATDADFLPEMAYDATAAETSYNINMSGFDKLTNLTWSSSLDNVNYVVGAANGEIDLGYVDFGTNAARKLVVESATNTTSTAMAYDFYKDSETQPFATIAAVNTGNLLYFDKMYSNAFNIGGIHAIKARFRSNTSNLKSIGFVPVTTTATVAVQGKTTIKVTTAERSITLSELDGRFVTLTDINGRTILSGHYRQPNMKINTAPGIYILRVDAETFKIMVQ